MRNSSNQTGSTARERAAKILEDISTCPPFKEFKALVKELKGDLDFGAARKLIAGVKPPGMKPDEAVWLTQQSALCTYKDEEMLPAKRFADALAMLETIGLRAPDKIDRALVPPHTLPETLALGGAVYKRMFEYSGQLENLHNALGLYRAAWNQDPKADMGYGGVNAAYVLDLLASRLEAVAKRTGTVSVEAQRLRGEAESLRREMAEKLPQFAAEKDEAEQKAAAAGEFVPLEKQYWYVVTLAEIHFGLRDYDEAARWLDKARKLDESRKLKSDEWERQTTFRQLLLLARLQNQNPPVENKQAAELDEPWKTLARFFDEGAEQAFSCWRGKVGLALSGGGFRASLFHLGVLARLAEMDVLRSVEVLSTVSGGSIVGAHYYLEVRNHLNTHPDAKITREDYIAIVGEVQKKFLQGVQTNLRTRVLTNLKCNLKMLIPRWLGLPAYTRSHRIGELYEEALYSSVKDGHPGDTPRKLCGILIQPKTEEAGGVFKPKFSNWRRRAKVPVLLLNSTTLNSGHSWHFTASWMGEPPGLVGETVDMNARYRRLYYGQAPTKDLQDYRLGYAVAASACVPSLFEPLEIKGLYPGRTVRLVDGGVHDNQGVAGLLDESCTFILCSDASGQMSDEPSPTDGSLGVPLRASSIQGDRVREAECQDLKARVENRALQGLFFIHLKQDLVPSGIDWVKCQDPHSEPPQCTTTSYGVDRDIQRKLAAIRTDLDTFTDVEAYALMLSGYLMTERQFKQLNDEYQKQGGAGTWGGFNVNAQPENWPFRDRELITIMSKAPDSTDLRRQDLAKQLEVGSRLVFKVWHLLPALRMTALTLAGIAGVSLVWLVITNWREQIDLGSWTVASLVVGAVLFVAGVAAPAIEWFNPQKAMRSWLVKLGLAVCGWVLANLHVIIFDRAYLKRGRLERLLNLPSE